ncbi:MAG: caspase family protein [Patescibacteria group bacterium]
MRHHILAIGISKHSSNFVNDLDFASKDAEEFFYLFTNNLSSLGYQKLLIDNEASLSAIRTALGDELEKEIKGDDAFFFFYSGHGATAESKETDELEHYLLPFDATTDIKNSSISVSYLKETFDKLALRAKFIFIDSCFSGSVANSKGYNYPKMKSGKSVKTFINAVVGKGHVIFTASKDNEEAVEDTDNKNGLFSHFLLKEFQEDRKSENFSISDTFTPIAKGVTQRAKTRFNHVQNPTSTIHLEGLVELPVFKKKILTKPTIIKPPEYKELSETAYPVLDLKFDNKELDNSIDFVTKNSQYHDKKLAKVVFKRYCAELMREVRIKWEKIFAESGNSINEVPKSVAKMEKESYQFILLGGVLAQFGSREQMNTYSKNATEFLKMSEEKSGLIPLISIPEAILAEIVYIIGLVSLFNEDLDPLKDILSTKVFESRRTDREPESLAFHNYIFYSDALGRSAIKVNDHIRKVISNTKWLFKLLPEIESDLILDYHLQVNYLIVMYCLKIGSPLWPDFGRFYPNRLMMLINKIKYDENFRKKVAAFLDIDENKLTETLTELLKQAQASLRGEGFWESIKEPDLLTEKEKEVIERASK